jgi:hypothetical protein
VRRGVLIICALAVLCVLRCASAAWNPWAHPDTSTPLRNCARFHGGRVEGDGEYRGGAMLGARRISCRAAFGLVPPRYQSILSYEEHHDGPHGPIAPYRLGRFRSSFEVTGRTP